MHREPIRVDRRLQKLLQFFNCLFVHFSSICSFRFLKKKMEKTQNASHQDEIFPIRNADYISKTATKQTLDQSAVNENNTSSSPLISRRDSIRKGPKNRIDVLLQVTFTSLYVQFVMNIYIIHFENNYSRKINNSSFKKRLNTSAS
jgi:hypothetical protein